MEFRVLGKLEAIRDGTPVELGAFRQRALLALLLTSPNSVFSTDQILDRLWGDDGGVEKQNALWVYVSGLRKALEPEREKRSDGSMLLTRAPGYVLHAEPEEVDSVRFERLVTEGRALAGTDPAAASLVLGEALALWRGHAFEEFTYEPFAQTEIARLEELRLEAVEARINADLERGLSRQLVSELESLVRQHPLQETLTGQLMLALYRSGRQADALRAFQNLKSKLVDELGIDPATRLRDLHDQIVTGDPSLDGRPSAIRADGVVPGLAVRGYELRDQLGERGSGLLYRAFQPAVGREVAVKVIRPELANDPDFIRRFQGEAQSVARLEHPHIVPLYDFWREPDAAYLVMRLMRGGTLADVLERRALRHDQVLALVDQIGSALQTAHRSGLVHRDVRPANILIDSDDNAYLTDFGIAVDADPSDVDRPSAWAADGAPYVSPEQLGHSDILATSDIYSFGVVVAQSLTGMSGEIGQIRGALPAQAMSVIDCATAVDPAMRYPTVDAFVAALHDAIGPTVTGREDPATDLGADLDNPYKGLRPFDAVDSDDFHGRERLVERLIGRLGNPGIRGRFIAVVGPSGSGKSSVVRAGLLPALRHWAVPLSGSWFTIEMTPAPHPFEELEEALLGVAVNPPASLLEQLVGEHGLQRALRRILPNDGSQLLLVIDQFEELFTQVDRETADRFIDALVSAVADEHSRLRVVVTLRADFYDRPLRYSGLGELLRDGSEVITPMTPEELERAVVGPVEPLGVTFEPALVTELVRDVVDRPGALPLLQYALTELFDERQGRTITHASYRELGGVSGALARRAEALLAGLGDSSHSAARQVFLRLVTLGEGTGDTRRRVLQSDLEQLSVDRAMLEAVLETFGRHRLLSFDRDPVTRSPTVEISHEALITEWARLRDWIDGARHDVGNQRRLADFMNEWVASDRGDDYLLRGGRLDQLHGWATTTTLPLSEPEQAFLDASVADRDRAADAARERRQHEVDAEQRSRRRSRQLIAVGLVAVLVSASAVFGAVQWRSAAEARASAEQNRSIAEDAATRAQDASDAADFLRAQAERSNEEMGARTLSRELAEASSMALAAGDPELAALYALQGVQASTELAGWAQFSTVDSLMWALQALGVRVDVTPNTLVAVRPGPNGLAGVWVLAPKELVALGLSAVDRSLTEDECRPFYGGPCPPHQEIPADLVLFYDYGSTRQDEQAMAGTRVTMASSVLANDPELQAAFEAFSDRTGIQVDLVESVAAATAVGRNLERADVVVSNGEFEAIVDRPEVRMFVDFMASR